MIQNALDKMVRRLHDCGAEHAGRIEACVAAARQAGPRGTMRSWLESHDHQTVDTYQTDPYGLRLWAPGPRSVCTRTKTYVTFDGSRRDYAGMRVVGATDECLLVASDHAVVVYLAEGAA